jgi:hypothetical protein
MREEPSTIFISCNYLQKVGSEYKPFIIFHFRGKDNKNGAGFFTLSRLLHLQIK